MAREIFLERGKDKGRFAIVPGKSSRNFPDEVSAEMLWNLWDIGAKFGREIGRRLEFKTQGIFMELYDLCHNAADANPGFVVGEIEDSGLMSQGVFFFELQNGLWVIWDKRLTSEKIIRAIGNIDEHALSKKLIQDGIRIVFNRAGPSPSGAGAMVPQTGKL